MRRLFLVAFGCYWLLAFAATPVASASRSYGALHIVKSYGLSGVMALRISDDGRHLTAAALRVKLGCVSSGALEHLAGPVQIVKRRPPFARRNRAVFLVRQAGSPGTLRYRVYHRQGAGRRTSTISGNLTLSRLTARALRVRLRLRHTTRRERCQRNLLLRGQRDSGKLYVGATNDHEPVWLRRQSADRARWIAGYKAECTPNDAVWQGLFAETFALSSPTAFSFRRGYPGTEIFYLAEITGAFTANQAAGTFRLHVSMIGHPAIGRTPQVYECDSQRTWRASAT
jgi:hypothetical protein